MPSSLAVAMTDGPARVTDGPVRVDAFPNTWKGTSDAELLRNAIAAGYEVIVTRDANMIAQQNLGGLGVVVLRTGRVQQLQAHASDIADSILRCPRGRFLVVEIDGSRHLTLDQPGSKIVAEPLPPVSPFTRNPQSEAD